MLIDADAAGVFGRHKGRVIRFLEKHQDISMTFTYMESVSGNTFDVRELPAEFVGEDRVAVDSGEDRDVHWRVIKRAIAGGHDFAPRYR